METEGLVKDQVKTLIDWLNLGGTSAVAALLDVSQPTIYNWFDSEHGIRDEDRQRLGKLNAVVDCWKAHLAEPMPHGAIWRRLPSGATLFDLLMQSDLDMGAIQEAVGLIAKSNQRSLDSINRLSLNAF